MAQARSDIAIVDLDGWSYAAGGCISNQSSVTSCTRITDLFERYNFSSNTWEILPPMPSPRYRYAAETVNGKIYYIAGRTVPDDNLVNTVDVYDTVTNTWASYNQSIYPPSDSYAIAIGEIIYIPGGYLVDYTSENEVLIINASEPNATLIAGAVAPMNYGRGDIGGARINGLVYIFGGFTDLNDFCAPLPVLEAYNPATNTWTILTNATYARGDMGPTVANSKLWIIGGESKVACNESYPVKTVEFFNTATNVWNSAVQYPIDAFRFSSGANGLTVFSFGGQNVINTSTSLYLYPVSNAVFSLDTQPYDSPAVQVAPAAFVLCLLAGLVTTASLS